MEGGLAGDLKPVPFSADRLIVAPPRGPWAFPEAKKVDEDEKSRLF
jgi:hypothetical protein